MRMGLQDKLEATTGEYLFTESGWNQRGLGEKT